MDKEFLLHHIDILVILIACKSCFYFVPKFCINAIFEGHLTTFISRIVETEESASTTFPTKASQSPLYFSELD